MSITEATIADIPALCALVNSAYRGDTSRKGWTTEADLLSGTRIDEAMLQEYMETPQSIVLTCLSNDGKIIGCVHLQKKQDQLYLGMLTVAPELQTDGIGKSLLQASENRAKKEGCQRIMMTVITRRHELIDWYKRHGYIETGEKQPFPTNERFGMPKVPLEFLVLQKTIKSG